MRIKLFGSALIALLLCLSAFGQTFGEISGAVRDSTGAAIPAAQVTVTNVEVRLPVVERPTGNDVVQAPQ